jgi:hypothetical protein
VAVTTHKGSAAAALPGTVTGVSGTYRTFAEQLSRLTGLSPRVIAAWELAEGGPPDNPLNIGPGAHYGSVQGAAQATAKLLHSSIYTGILGSAGKPDQTQIAAIAASKWCPGCAGYQGLIQGTYQRVGGSSAPLGPAGAASQSKTGAAVMSSSSGRFSDAQRSSGVKALLWVLLVIGGAALAGLGAGQSIGVGRPHLPRAAKAVG